MKDFKKNIFQQTDSKLLAAGNFPFVSFLFVTKLKFQISICFCFDIKTLIYCLTFNFKRKLLGGLLIIIFKRDKIFTK